MKKLFIAVIFVFSFYNGFSQTRVDTLLQLLHDPSEDHVFVIAHRGDWRNAPENSLQAIERSIQMGVDMVELDVGMTKDSVLILMHDSTVDRTTNGKGKVSDHTLAEIKELRLRDGLRVVLQNQQVPTLEEALKVCRGRILVNVDKASNYMDRVQAVLKETGCESQVLFKGSRKLETVQKQYGNLLEDILYMPIVSESTEDLDRFVNDFIAHHQPIAFEVLLRNDDSPIYAQIDKMKKAGIRVWINSLWPRLNAGRDDERAVYEPDESWGWLIQQGASMIQTDRPQELIDYLTQKGLRKY